MRDYYDNRWHYHGIGPDAVRVPTAVALSPTSSCPRARRPASGPSDFNIVRWTPMPRGGHFAPAEAALAFRDIGEYSPR